MCSHDFMAYYIRSMCVQNAMHQHRWRRQHRQWRTTTMDGFIVSSIVANLDIFDECLRFDAQSTCRSVNVCVSSYRRQIDREREIERTEKVVVVALKRNLNKQCVRRVKNKKHDRRHIAHNRYWCWALRWYNCDIQFYSWLLTLYRVNIYSTAQKRWKRKTNCAHVDTYWNGIYVHRIAEWRKRNQ